MLFGDPRAWRGYTNAVKTSGVIVVGLICLRPGSSPAADRQKRMPEVC
jgi:hypothetical protein